MDLVRPGRRETEGIHKVIWDRLHHEPFVLPPDTRLTVVAYKAGFETVAYIEPFAVGELLPEMPIFFSSDHYGSCPVEASCMAAWEPFPARVKDPLEAPSVT